MSAIIQTLKTKKNGIEKAVYPRTIFEAIVDSKTNQSLDVILNNQLETKSNLSLYHFKSTKDFPVTDSKVPILYMFFNALEDTFAIWNCVIQVTVEIDDILKTSSLIITNADGSTSTYNVPYTQPDFINLTVEYELNSEMLVKKDIITLSKGSHLINLYMPFTEIEKGIYNKFLVYITCDKGIVNIPKGSFECTVLGSDIEVTFEEENIIRLNFNDKINNVAVNSLEIIDFKEAINIDSNLLTNSSEFVENIGYISFNAPTIAGFTESITAKRK